MESNMTAPKKSNKKPTPKRDDLLKTKTKKVSKKKSPPKKKVVDITPSEILIPLPLVLPVHPLVSPPVEDMDPPAFYQDVCDKDCDSCEDCGDSRGPVRKMTDSVREFFKSFFEAFQTL